MEAEKIAEIQSMIKNHQEAVINANQRVPVAPSGHNVGDEDISKVAPSEPMWKSGEDLIK